MEGRGSGRYEWKGSPKRHTHQEDWNFYSRYIKLKNEAFSEKEITTALDLKTVKELRSKTKEAFENVKTDLKEERN